jgi:hypothetical protein
MRNTEILEEGGHFQILGFGRVKTLHHQESRNRKMRNDEILEEGGQFRIPGVGRVNTLYHQESQSCEMRNNEMSKTLYWSFGYRELEESRVKTLHHRSPEVTKPKVTKYEITKCQRLHTGVPDTRSWRSQESRLFITGVLKSQTRSREMGNREMSKTPY